MHANNLQISSAKLDDHVDKKSLYTPLYFPQTSCYNSKDKNHRTGTSAL